MVQTNTRMTDAAEASILRGQVQGAMVLTGAGLGWVMFALSTQGPISLGTLLLVLAIPAVLILSGLMIRQKSQGIPDLVWSTEMSRVFRLACIFEIVAALLIVLVAAMTHHTEWILPLLAIVVGLHFFPLARVFDRPLYFATGTLLCLVGLATMLFMPPHLGTSQLFEWPLVAGVGYGAVLWSTA